MSDETFLTDFRVKWSKMRARLRENPFDHGVIHTRLLKMWRLQGGLCHLCGGRVPHPIDELHLVTDDNAPTADHLRPKIDGGGKGKNLRMAHRWCNSRRGRAPLGKPLRRMIRTEAAAIFQILEANGQSASI